MNKQDFLKELENEYKAVSAKVELLERTIVESKQDLEYWTRQKDALSTVKLRIHLDENKARKLQKGE